jgi:phosphoglycerate dehydrogenase-like enzyme
MSIATVTYTDPPWSAATRAGEFPERSWLAGTAEVCVIPPAADGQPRTPQALSRLVPHSEVVVVYRSQVTDAILEAAGPRLRAIIRQGVGIDNLNVSLIRKHDRLHAINVPDYCVDEVAAHTVALLLAVERGLVPQHNALASGVFDVYGVTTPRRLNRRRAAIVGFGRIGRAVSRRLQAFYREVLVYDPFVADDLVEGYGATPVPDLAELLRNADALTLHCPLTPRTAGMIGAAELRLLPAGAVLVNAARGALVQPEPLADALRTGHLLGAGIDVFSPEDPTRDPRWHGVLRSPRAVVTSHRAFLSVEAEDSNRRRVAMLARDFVQGRPVPGCLAHGGSDCAGPADTGLERDRGIS